MFGVEFGKPYLNLLETGSMVPDSNDAAIGFGVLRSFLPKGEHVNLASKMHEAFYLDGKSLSDVETIESIAKSYDLPADKIAEEFIRISEEGKYHPDFYEARKIGVTSFPTLFLEINGKYYDLKGSAITLNDLEGNMKPELQEVFLDPICQDPIVDIGTFSGDHNYVDTTMIKNYYLWEIDNYCDMKLQDQLIEK